MTWARLDDGFWRNEKVIACSDAALGLHVRAISYCADQRTDGALSKAALVVLRAKAGRIADLVAAGLWDEAGAGYVIHDFLKYNPSASQVDSKRHSKAIAGAKGAASRWHGGENAPVPDPVPIPDPVAKQPDPTAVADLVTRCVRAYDGLMGTAAATIPILGKIEEWTQSRQWATEDQAAEWFEKACETAALANVRNLKYVLGILSRWDREGFQVDTRRPNGAPVGSNAAVSAFDPEYRIPGVRDIDWSEAPYLAADASDAVDRVRPPADPALGEGRSGGARATSKLPRAED